MELSPVLEPAPSGRLLFISPHLDDAVFGCGRTLASVRDALVVTVFAGRPADGAPLTEWDRASGFAPGDDVVGLRRDEDRRALELLGAQPHWLEFRDDQYGDTAAPAEIAAHLGALLRDWDPAAVFMPLGLFHADHHRARDAALVLCGRHRAPAWYAYEEAFYRLIPGLRAEALARLRTAGLSPEARAFAETQQAAARKRRAVACYGSQLRALATPGRPGSGDLERAETYWLLRMEDNT